VYLWLAVRTRGFPERVRGRGGALCRPRARKGKKKRERPRGERGKWALPHPPASPASSHTMDHERERTSRHFKSPASPYSSSRGTKYHSQGGGMNEYPISSLSVTIQLSFAFNWRRSINIKASWSRGCREGSKFSKIHNFLSLDYQLSSIHRILA
jgi:hypothetical protein